MKQRLGIVLVLALLLLVRGVQAAPHTADMGSLDSDAIDRYVETEMKAARIPGMALGIVKDGEILYLKGYGVADPTGRAVTPQTPFFLGSVSKSFTALAIMQLAEAGKLELDAPVQTYLPWFRLADEEAAAQITVRQLLNQTSGISTYAGELAFNCAASETIESLVRKQSNLALSAPVGAVFQYSNTNYVILGAIVQAVSGQSFGEYVQEQIFRPLEMAHSFASLGAAEADGAATGHQYLFGFPVPTNGAYRIANLPSGYLASSAEDMCHYLLMWLNEGRYGDTALVTPEGAKTLQQPAAAVTSYTRYAMGWYTNPDASVVWHGGSTVNFRASMKIMNGQSLGVIALYNITDDTLQAIFGQGYIIPDGVISLLYGEKPPSAGFIGTGQIFFVLDALGLLALAVLVASIAGLGRWRASWAAGRRRWLKLIVLIVVNFLLPVWVLVQVSMLVAWSVVLVNLPDFGYLVLLLAALLLISGLAKLGLLASLHRRRRAPAS